MNEKDIYKLLNNIDIEDEIMEFEDISEIEKEKIKRDIKSDVRFKSKNKNKNNSKNKKYIAVAAASLIVISSFNSSIPKTIYAKTMSTLDNISLSISELLNTNNDISDYATTINKSIEYDGVNIKLGDVIIDDDQLIITSLVEVEDTSIDNISFDYNIKINGKTIKEGSSFGSTGKIEKDSNIFSDVRYISVDKDLLDEDKLNLDLSINKVYLSRENTETNKKVKGKWDYSFTATTEELRKDTNVLNINEKFTIGKNEYEIENIIINPVNQIIKVKPLNDSTLDSQIKFEGYDDLERAVVFDLSSFDGEELIFKYNNYSEDLRLDFESLNLNIYTREYPKESGRLSGEWEKLDKEIIIKK